MQHRVRGWTLAGLVLAWPATGAALQAPAALSAAPAPGATLELALCPHLAPETGARCGTYHVWEDRDAGSGRRLGLDVIVLPATGDDPQPDPMVFLAGGPGVGATAFAPGLLDWPVRTRRDIVLVDQRGTGGDHRLACDDPDRDPDAPLDLQAAIDPGFDLDALLACRDRIGDRADLDLYTTPIAMDDLDEVLDALGYGAVNLLGGSYGTRAGLVFMRRHGDRVRCAILEGVAPFAMRNPLMHAPAAQRAIDLLFDACAADPEQPALVDVTHPQTGEPVQVRLSREAFAESVRAMSYMSTTAVGLPALIHAAHGGAYETFVLHGAQTASGVFDAIAMGMLLCVTCPADVVHITEQDVLRYTAGTYLGDGRVRRQMAICEQWPLGELPPDYTDPVAVDVPMLIISGLYDPVTPPSFGELVAAAQASARHVVVPRAHDLWGGCLDELERAFLEHPEPNVLDTSCVEDMTLPPFVLPLEEAR